MKRIIFTAFKYSALLFVLNFTACKKSNDTNYSNSFTWTFTGTNYIANFKTAYQTSIGSGPLIVAGMGTSEISSGTGPRISLTSLNTGTYNFGTGSTNVFRYVNDAGEALGVTSGTLNITENSNNHLSGNFSAILIDISSTTNTLTGTFSGIDIEQ